MKQEYLGQTILSGATDKAGQNALDEELQKSCQLISVCTVN